ncbi:aminotransferase class I/II-fold pyridoxal phosphate-dependent enzyme [Paenibacillus glycinis]|uniref:Aminotransferase class I/II-fold pyridoxal phosphate-dependent enzyme n=1 Tax=Paenibacillus glycinis TaxID=2697035 RepID=A0ABW9XZF7_9BACL|nr:aminotransferase class I/II-fold pyridoxal phosphate-dependent enzyme [Paenibacillus glycinis]NBD28118.1 aminotransferase class I/II-fold pyridoxal phosphate-dependent enzyme [Paenibacillus glycinis]
MDSQSKQNWHAPLFEALTNLHASRPVSYHVPGHKYGQSLPLLQDLKNDALSALRAVMAIDVTELSLTDDLHEPTGVIEEAQTLAAATFGADHTFFLVGGSTAGNLAMLLAVCEPDDLIIVQRNAHKSVLNGLKLSGARAVFLMPARDEDTGLDIAPTLVQVEQALRSYPEAKAVMLTNPSYYGLSVHLRPYAELIHRYGKLLLVDEAHGAHYALHPTLPTSALQAGADAVVQSTHKTLQALTMGAMLHIQGDRINRNAVMDALRMIQSSSPSYPIMASLDITRAMIDFRGLEMFERGLASSEAFRNWVNEQEDYGIANSTGKEVRNDPLRVVLYDRLGRLTGFEIQKRLEAFGCYTELADSRHVVLLIGVEASAEDIERLKQALGVIAMDAAREGRAPRTMEQWHRSSMNRQIQPISEPVTFSRTGASRTNGASTERIALDDAVGRFSSEAVIPYPPGIPLLYEGERITSEAIRTIKQLVADGARCQGAADPTMRTIAVTAEA